MNFKQPLVSGALALSLLATSVVPALAVENTASPAANRCARVNERAGRQLEKIQAAKTRRVDRWEKISDRVGRIRDHLKAKGQDVSKLDTDKATLDGYIATFKADWDTLVADAQTAKNDSCNDPTKFRTDMQALRTAMQKAKTDWQTLHDFVVNTLKPDVLSYKPTPSTTATPTQ